MWQELMKVMQEISGEYGSLRAIEEKKHGLLIAVDLPQLESAVKEESVHTAKIGELEARRKAILAKLAGLERNLRPEMKMAELFAVAPDPRVREELQRLHKELDERVEAVIRQNEINSILVHGALNAVNVRLNKLSGASVEPAYGQGGKDIVSHRKNFEFRA